MPAVRCSHCCFCNSSKNTGTWRHTKTEQLGQHPVHTRSQSSVRLLLYEDLYIKHKDSLRFYPLSRVMSTSKWPLKVSEERVQMYRARRNQHLAAAVTDGDHEPEVDPYAFEEGDVKFTFSNKKDKSGGEREPGKKHKVRPAKERGMLLSC